MNFDRMRSLLLEQAIRGELVPQLDSEGVVEQVGDAPEEIPFEIPESWKWTYLGKIVDVVSSRRVKKEDWRSEGIPFYRAREIVKLAKYGEVDNELFIDEELFDSLKIVGYPSKGDLMVSAVGTLGAAYVVKEQDNFYYKDASVLCFKNKGKAFPEYLKYLLESPYLKSVIESNSSGTTVGTITIKNAKNFLIPLPPLEEQKRIVDKLEKAFAEIDRAEKAYQELQTLCNALTKQILQKAIQGRLVPQLESEPAVETFIDEPKDVPFEIPKKWKWTKLGSIGSWKAGATPNRSNSSFYINGTIPWLKTGDLNDGIVESVPEFITNKALDNCSLRLNPCGSVLMAMYGATIGKVGILNIACTTNQACCACIVDEKIVNKWWLFYYLLSQRSNFIELGAGGAQPNISRQKIVSYLIPIPPIEEQYRIIQKLESLLSKVNELTSA